MTVTAVLRPLVFNMWNYTYFWGQTLQYYIKKEQKPAPLFLGYCILVFAVVGCIIEPISVFWLFLPQALVIIAANRKKSI